jgi:C1A family cysteine protease
MKKTLLIALVSLTFLRSAYASHLSHDDDVKLLHTIIKPKYNLEKSGDRTPKLHAKLLKRAQKSARKNFLEVTETPLPLKVDLRPTCPSTVWDQGKLGACTAHAVSAAIMQDQIADGNKSPVMPSRLQLYYQGRWEMGKEEGNSTKYLTKDSGATIAAAMIAMSYGFAPESEEGYSDNSKQYKQAPNPDQYKDGVALFNQDKIAYTSISGDLPSLKQWFNKAGKGIVIGIDVYESFESNTATKTGFIPLPKTKTEELLGGHAIFLVGYDDNLTAPDGTKGHFIFRNSWSSKWGDKGYGYLPYTFLTNKLMDEFWGITEITNPTAVQKYTAKQLKKAQKLEEQRKALEEEKQKKDLERKEASKSKVGTKPKAKKKRI